MKRTSLAMTAAKALAGVPFFEADVARMLAALRHGRPTKLLAQLARRLVREVGEGRRPRVRQIAAILDDSAAFARLFPTVREMARVPRMLPAAGAPQRWKLPRIATAQALCDWLGIGPDTLQWLAAQWRTDAGRHYRFAWIPRRGKLPRLIEAPLPVLKSIQRRILRGILSRIPAHDAAHGFVKKRGIVSFASPHAGRRCVLRMDVQDFFPTIRRARVLRVFLTAGYPEPVAALLANLCTATTPAAVRAAIPGEAASLLRRRLQTAHLPQGAPTSPALANLCAFRLDARLAGLAAKFGATYTRYADDLLFSGGDEFRRDVRRCEALAGAILIEESFTPAFRKTRIMPSSVSQRAAGLVINAHPALPRRERDRLKAILTNCIRHGPESQNRGNHPDFHAHLLGHVTHAEHVHPASGAKLRALFDAVEW